MSRCGKLGLGNTAWGLNDFEPPLVQADEFPSTEAIPGSDEKLAVLMDRVRRGLPLWHPGDHRPENDVED